MSGTFYAVKVGRNKGIYSSWSECNKNVSGYPGAQYKKFRSFRDAKSFVDGNDITMSSPSSSQNVEGATVIFCDGSCMGNGTSDAIAGIGVWFPGTRYQISDRCPGEQTNNRAELFAIVKALETTRTDPIIHIFTDSKYAIGCCTTWLSKWKGNKFVTATGSSVANVGMIKYISTLLDERSANGYKTTFSFVKAHSTDNNNNIADRLAKEGVEKTWEKDPDWEFLTSVIS